MTSLPFFQVDAFAAKAFEGNPAAVMPLETWLPDEMMQTIAAENNLAETAFLVKSDRDDADYDLRWFTPTVEVDLCGHATLASAHVLPFEDRVRFATRSGILTVEKRDGLLWLDLPAGTVEPGTEPGLLDALGLPGDTPCFLGRGGNGAAIALLADEAAVLGVDPDFRALKAYDRLVMVTAPGTATEVVSRVFAAYHGIDEDPATGSAHGSLVPFWAERLSRPRFTALQASKRGGRLECEHAPAPAEAGGGSGVARRDVRNGGRRAVSDLSEKPDHLGFGVRLTVRAANRWPKIFRRSLPDSPFAHSYLNSRQS